MLKCECLRESELVTEESARLSPHTVAVLRGLVLIVGSAVLELADSTLHSHTRSLKMMFLPSLAE